MHTYTVSPREIFLALVPLSIAVFQCRLVTKERNVNFFLPFFSLLIPSSFLSSHSHLSLSHLLSFLVSLDFFGCESHYLEIKKRQHKALELGIWVIMWVVFVVMMVMEWGDCKKGR